MAFYDIAGGLRDTSRDFANGYSTGKDLVQTQQQGKLASLVSQAMGQQGQDRTATLQQAAALDPTAAMNADAYLRKADNANQSHIDDAHARIGKAAVFMQSALATKDPQKIEAAYQLVRPALADYGQKYGGGQVPSQTFDPAMAPKIEALAGMYGQAQDGDQFTLAPGSARYDKNGNVIAKQPFSENKWELQRAEDGTVYRVNPQTGESMVVTLGGGANQGVGPQTGATINKAYQNAIGGIESLGSGDYNAVGPVTKTGDKAYGKYQVMGANIPQWTLAATGKSMTPQEFLANPQAQDAVFNKYFGSYVSKYGPEGAARAWFAGEGGMNNLGARDVNGMSVGRYGQKFAQAAGVPLNLGSKVKDESYRTMSAAEVKSMGLPDGTIAQVGPKGQVSIVNKPKDMPNASGGQVIDNGDGTTTFIPVGKVSEQERNAAGFYSRMVAADKELEKIASTGYDPTNLRDYLTVGGRFTNGISSDNGQLYHQAAQNWVRANLRKESGAAIGVAEMDQEIKNYFPQYGDSAAVIKQKADNRKVVESAMRTAAGNALPSMPQTQKAKTGGVLRYDPATGEFH